MEDKELILYLKNWQSKGYSKEVIINHLKKKGYSDEFIQEKVSPFIASQTNSFKQSKPRKFYFSFFIFIIIFMILVFTIFLYFLVLPSKNIYVRENLENVELIIREDNIPVFSNALNVLAEKSISTVEMKEFRDGWVSELQEALLILKYKNMKDRHITVDGYFGPQTMYALENFINHENLTPFVIDVNLINRIKTRLQEQNIELNLVYLEGETNFLDIYLYQNLHEIKELQNYLNSIVDNQESIIVNGNYDYPTASRILQIKKIYNKFSGTTKKLKEDLSFDNKILEALKNIEYIRDINAVRGVEWEDSSSKLYKDKESREKYLKDNFG
jgi:hypothetical protein